MSEYQAPVEEMVFALTRQENFTELCALPGGEELSVEFLAAIFDEASKFAGQEISPLNRTGDQQGLKLTPEAEVITPTGFKQAYQQYQQNGWGSLQFSQQYGGQNLPFAVGIAVQEMWHAANMAWGLCPLLSQGAIEAIEANASQHLKDTYLPKMVSGEWSGTMNLTEPQSGSDLATIKSRAERDGEHYRIKGQKIFITWGEHDMCDNIIHLVLARLPDAPAGVKGISLFLVPKFLLDENGEASQRNDLRVVSIEEKIGIHASPTCVMSFGDNDGAIGYLIGEENQGLACMFRMMNNARLTVGLQGVAVSGRAYQRARDFARERTQGVAPGETDFGPIIKHPDIRRMLMIMRSCASAARALTYDACLSVDLQHRYPDVDRQQQHAARSALLTPIVKGWNTELAQEVTSLGIQIHGGMGFVEETGAAQYYRDARILPIYEGTNGIQAADLVGRKTSGDGGQASDRLFAEMQTVCEQAAGHGELMQALADKLISSITLARTCKDSLLQTMQSDEFYAGSAAFNYLMVMGYVCGSWQLIKLASASFTALDAGEIDAQSHEVRVADAQFFVSQLLPRASAHAQMMQEATAAVMFLSEDRF